LKEKHIDPLDHCDPYDDDPPADIAVQPGTGPFSQEETAQVLRWHGQGVGRNEIARRTGRGRGTISRVVKAAGLSFDRDTQMAPVRAQRASDLTLKRLALAHRAADEAAHLFDRLRAPIVTRRINSRTGATETVRANIPDPAQVRDLSVGIGILMSKVSEALSVNDPDAGRSAILTLVERLNVTYRNDQATADQVIDQPKESD
jgi:hypothetical protein